MSDGISVGDISRGYQWGVSVGYQWVSTYVLGVGTGVGWLSGRNLAVNKGKFQSERNQNKRHVISRRKNRNKRHIISGRKNPLDAKIHV
jgi:hypothetical protein